MPFYEYKCAECEKKIEIFQQINDEPLKKCESCSGKLKRLIPKSVQSQVNRSAKEAGEIIKEQAKKDVEDIRNGDWEKAADYLGEKGALEYYGKK